MEGNKNFDWGESVVIRLLYQYHVVNIFQDMIIDVQED